jgi:5-hydroxyisourate hydrolase
MSGRLTTHVLDITRGHPAANLTIELHQMDPSGETRLLKTVQTNSDGRTSEPLLQGEELQVGTYQIVFDVGDYFGTQGEPASNPPFLDRIPIRFGISDPDAHYHVPLLVSPWSYSTYRGS